MTGCQVDEPGTAADRFPSKKEPPETFSPASQFLFNEAKHPAELCRPYSLKASQLFKLSC